MRRWLGLTGWMAFVGASCRPPSPRTLVSSRPDPRPRRSPGAGPRRALAPARAGRGLLVGRFDGFVPGWSSGRIPAAIRAVSWATIGPVRRLVDGIVAGALVATRWSSLNAGAMTGPGYIPVPAGDPIGQKSGHPRDRHPGSVSPRNVPNSPKAEPIRPPPPISEPVAVAPPATVSNVPFSEWSCAPETTCGHLAEQRLTWYCGREVSDVEIAPYWLKVVGTNLPTSDRAILTSFSRRDPGPAGDRPLNASGCLKPRTSSLEPA